ncbi:hypothetical protein RRG08_015290 [Elysia crispata]|uniref:Uncharacterized protein n=1 Tax=Elysia crispata TaxID=231223 RepID=A0AAE0ZUA0_9GAST|nr:hypothetical protein RRG08_015290 [Elysia crispata]
MESDQNNRLPISSWTDTRTTDYQYHGQIPEQRTTNTMDRYHNNGLPIPWTDTTTTDYQYHGQIPEQRTTNTIDRYQNNGLPIPWTDT